ncbi:MAG: hypothetical protein AABX84_02645, partial [Nanoarchaeota archaeon]
MVYKKYIKRNGKVFGPYAYHSKKINGRVISEYRGKSEKNHLDSFLLISVFVLFFFSIGLVFLLNPDYIQGAKNIAFNSINSITGLVTEEPVIGVPAEEIMPEAETTLETPVEEIPQEEITPNNSIQEIETTEILTNETVTEFDINTSILNESIEILGNQTEIINETITSENITEIVPNENISEEQIPVENFTINETILTNITEQNITNETILNGTIANLTLENVTINTIQFQAILNQPVKWRKEIIPESLGNVTIILPKNSENVTIKKVKDEIEEDITYESAITGAVVGGNGNFILRFLENIIGKITGKAVDEPVSENAENEIEIEVEIEIDDSNAEYEVEYETPAPYAIEQELEDKKVVSVFGPEEIHYTDVLAFTNLNESLNANNPGRVRIHWIEDNSYLNPVFVEDKDGNGI